MPDISHTPVLHRRRWKQDRLTAYVDPYIGSGEHGHVFVGANVPFGAVQVGPQNILRDGTGVPVIITPIVSLSDLVIRI